MKGDADSVAGKAKGGGRKAKPESKAGAKKAPARKTVGKKQAAKKAGRVVAPVGEKLKSRKAETLKLEKKKPGKKPVSKKVAKKRGARKAVAVVEPKKNGRPTLLTDEVLEKICAGLSEGTPLTIICKPEEMPAPRTVRDWMKAYEEVSAAITCAREEGGDFIAWQILTIADNTGHEAKDSIETDFGSIPNKEWMMRSKLRCDVRLQLLAKWFPTRYGNKVTAEISGPGGGAVPVQQEMVLSPEMEAKLLEAAALGASLVPPACLAGDEAADESPDEE